MKRRSLLAILFFPVMLQAAPLEVENLFDSNSQIPTVLIPLRVKGDVIAAGGSVFNVTLVTSNDADCRIMKDPFLAHIYLLKCDAESEVEVRFKAYRDGQLHELVYGPLEIKLPDGTELIKPKPKDNSAEILAGKQLYNSYCITCHNPPHLKKGRTWQQIKNSVAAQPKMQYLMPVFTDADYKKMEAYLKSL